MNIAVVGANTTVTIGTNSITLLGNGAGANGITIADFHFA